MDAKLRAYLKRQGVSDAALDKLERGEVPDDDHVLRKGTSDNPLVEKFKQCDECSGKSKSGWAVLKKQSYIAAPSPAVPSYSRLEKLTATPASTARSPRWRKELRNDHDASHCG